jgi:membrane protein
MEGEGGTKRFAKQLAFSNVISNAKAPVHLLPRAVSLPAAEKSMDIKGITTLFKRSFENWNKHNATRMGAALAFYTIVSISPLVIVVLGIASLVFNKNAAEAQLLEEVRKLVGAQAKESIHTILVHGHQTYSGVFSTIVGVAILFVGASGVFQELRSGLNNIWEAEATVRPGIWGILKERGLSFGMVLSLGFVLMVSLVVSAALAAMTKYFSGLLPFSPLILEAVNFLVSFAGIGALFACILKYVPAAPVNWRDVRVGAVFTALLFVIGKIALGFYLGKSSPGSAYGAAGSLVVLVSWVYYSAQIFYFGAEFTHAHALANRKQLEEPVKRAA